MKFLARFASVCCYGAALLVLAPNPLKAGDTSLENGDVVRFKCLGEAKDRGVRWLSGDARDGSVTLADKEKALGTRWKVEKQTDGSVHLHCLDQRKGELRYLDGVTHESRVALQKNTAASGTRWHVVAQSKNVIQLKCLGERDGPRWLHGHPVKGSVALGHEAKGSLGGGNWEVIWEKKTTVAKLEPPKPDIAEQVEALKQEFKPRGEALDKVVDKARKAKDEKAADEGVQAWRQLAADYAKRFMALVEKNPRDVAAGDALLWILDKAARSPEMPRAVKMLEMEHLQNPHIKSYLPDLSQRLRRWPGEFPDIERFLRVVHEKNTDRDTQALACYALAMGLKHHGNPELRKEAESLFELCVTKYPDCIVPQEHHIKKGKLIERAKEELSQIRKLAVGQVAPEIAGYDLEGKAFKLSDYRGKVVLLTFWGAWCPGSRKHTKQYTELVKRLHGKPFEIVGINSDRKPETAKSHIEKTQITWRSFSNEGKGLGGAIQKEWNVHAGLTIYLLDHNGVIRPHHGGLDAEDLYKTIAPLVEAAEKVRARK